MPTGYTSKLYEGEQSFNDFILRCARALGALITMRDDDWDVPIPKELEVDDYHAKRISEAKARLTKFEKLTDEQIQKKIDKQYAQRIKEDMESKKENDDRRNRYQAMIAQVKAWNPPTKDHEGLKKFMLSQLTESMEHDCHDYSKEKPHAKPTVAEWKKDELESIRWDVDYHTKENQEEIERTRGRNEWLQALWGSLNKEPRHDQQQATDD